MRLLRALLNQYLLVGRRHAVVPLTTSWCAQNSQISKWTATIIRNRCAKSLFRRRLAESMSPVRRLLTGGRWTLAFLVECKNCRQAGVIIEGAVDRAQRPLPDHAAAKLFCLSLSTLLRFGVSIYLPWSFLFIYFFPVIFPILSLLLAK